MGIVDLFRVLRKRGAVTRVHMSAFSGKTAAIDGMGWLYRAAYTCAREFFADPMAPQVIDFCAQRLSKLIACGVKPFFVFDGRALPTKGHTYLKRTDARESARAKIRAAGESSSAEDMLGYYQQAISIGYRTMRNFIDFLEKKNIPFIVAPYEADPQLAYLVKIGCANIVLSDDSDLLVYQTPVLLFQLNNDMQADCIRYQDVLDMNFSDDQFKRFCIICGCDYLPRIQGISYKTVQQLVLKYNSVTDIVKILKKTGFNVPNDYAAQFRKAYNTFCHQMVYDPMLEKMLPFSYIEEQPEYIGEMIPEELLEKHIKGKIDPHQNE